MIAKKEAFGFRKLLNQFIIIKDDNRNNNIVKTVFQHEKMDNAILTYCFVHPQRGISFEVLAMANITNTGMSDGLFKIDIREANSTTSLLIEYSSIEGELMEFKPNKNWPLYKDFENKISISRHRDYETPQEVRDMREISQIDKYRHEIYPDDLVVIFIGKLPKPEAIWCKGVLSDDGEMKGRLLNEPWDSSIGYHQDDLVNLEIRCVDGKEGLFAIIDNEDDEEQKRLSLELIKLKEILKENPEFSTDSIRFNELVANCNLRERLKDNLLLCIEDDIVTKILSLEAYTDGVVEQMATQLTNDCNMEYEQAIEAVLWWMNILELDEAGRKERNRRLQKVINAVSLEVDNPTKEEVIVKKPAVPLPNLDVLDELDIQLKELMGKEEVIIDAEYREIPDVLSSIQSQLDDLLGDLNDGKDSVPIEKVSRKFMSLQKIIEEADFQFPIDVQASNWEPDKHMEIETIRDDYVYGSIYKGKEYVDMERLQLRSNMRFAFYEK